MSEMRTCTNCHTAKGPKEFAKYRKKATGTTAVDTCRACDKRAAIARYVKTPAGRRSARAYHAKKHARYRQALRVRMTENPCAVCRERYPHYVMVLQTRTKRIMCANCCLIEADATKQARARAKAESSNLLEVQADEGSR